jgi:hypothetical protein
MKFGTVPICPGAAQAGYIIKAVQDVPMRGHAEHFVNGDEGLTWGCALSKMADDPENKPRFPHPLSKLFVTGKTTCYALTGEKYKGVFVYFQYAHNYGTQLDLNDAGLSQKLAKETPEVFEQEFLLRAPPKKKRGIKTQPSGRKASSSRKPFRVHGASLRALAAGLITEEEVQEMRSSMNAYERTRLSSIMSRKK